MSRRRPRDRLRQPSQMKYPQKMEKAESMFYRFCFFILCVQIPEICLIFRMAEGQGVKEEGAGQECQIQSCQQGHLLGVHLRK